MISKLFLFFHVPVIFFWRILFQFLLNVVTICHPTSDWCIFWMLNSLFLSIYSAVCTINSTDHFGADLIKLQFFIIYMHYVIMACARIPIVLLIWSFKKHCIRVPKKHNLWWGIFMVLNFKLLDERHTLLSK